MLNSISENIKKISFKLEEARIKYNRENDNIRIMAVTKTVSPDRINHAVEQGLNLLGENRVQEYLDKKSSYLPTAEVHFIGHLQSNKVKYIINSVKMIHSVDSIKLAEEINRLAASHGLTMDILAEVNIGGETSKSGLPPEQILDFAYNIAKFDNLRLCGLMTIPPPDNPEHYFEKMFRLYDDLRSERINNTAISILSMGMSSDYIEAIKHGSNIVRIGSGIFGARN